MHTDEGDSYSLWIGYLDEEKYIKSYPIGISSIKIHWKNCNCEMSTKFDKDIRFPRKEGCDTLVVSFRRLAGFVYRLPEYYVFNNGQITSYLYGD